MATRPDAPPPPPRRPGGPGGQGGHGGPGGPRAPSKDETALLPPFAGLPLSHIHVPASPAEMAAAAQAILAAGLCGFDTESKPTFAVGEASQGPHVLQFALVDRAYIFQMHRPGCAEALTGLLQSAALLKVGFGLESDRGQIRNRFGVLPQGLLDLNSAFHRLGYRGSTGVRAAVGIVFGQRFAKNKKVTTSNWALPQLGAAQLLYAANDAFGALRVWQGLLDQHPHLAHPLMGQPLQPARQPVQPTAPAPQVARGDTGLAAGSANIKTRPPT